MGGVIVLFARVRCHSFDRCTEMRVRRMSYLCLVVVVMTIKDCVRVQATGDRRWSSDMDVGEDDDDGDDDVANMAHTRRWYLSSQLMPANRGDVMQHVPSN